MPFDPSFLPNIHDDSNPFDFIPALLPVDFRTTSRLDMNPLELDRTLESPLGLGFDSPFSEQFLASPMFSTDRSMPFDSPIIDYTSLFDVVASPMPSATSTAPPTKATKSKKIKTPKSTLLPLDAPVRPRNYVTPSATSRKRKTVPVERALLKRAKSSSTPSTSSTPSLPVINTDADELPADLVSAVEKKRLLNTISARKSRMRKQSHLAELQETKEALLLENEELKRRIEELEAKFGQSR